MSHVALTLILLPQRLSICRLPPRASVPAWVLDEPLASFTRTPDELSIIAPDDRVPAEWTAERGWRCLQVAGPLAFELTGILASLTAPLADAGVPVFALSTYDTDLLLVRAQGLNAAIVSLKRAGHTVLMPTRNKELERGAD